MLRILSPKRSPEVLADRAGGVAQRLGYTEPPADTAHGFDVDGDHVEHVFERDKSSRRRLRRFDCRVWGVRALDEPF